MTDVEFEQQIARIVEFLGQPGSKVTWNDHIPDPDNPKQPRQIDITIVRNGRRTHIECRHRGRKQDVGWVEGLIGRRKSLRAHTIMAVSSSGFSEGAIRKAKRHGVILRDFETLSEEEIRGWGETTKITLRYVKFERTKLFPILSRLEIRSICKPVKFRTEEGTAWSPREIYNSVASHIDEGALSSGYVWQQCFAQDLFVNGIPVKELFFEARWRKLNVQVEVPVVCVYGKPLHVDLLKYEARIEKFNQRGFEIYRSPKEVVPVVDFSLAKPIKGAVFRGMDFDFREPVSIRKWGFVGQNETSIALTSLKLQPVREGSDKYYSLLSTARNGVRIF